MYILGDWHLNKWVKWWFTLELYCLPGNFYILYVQDGITFILNCVLKTVLCTSKWLTYNQHKKVYQIIKSWYLKVIYPACYLQIGFIIDKSLPQRQSLQFCFFMTQFVSGLICESAKKNIAHMMSLWNIPSPMSPS